MSSSTTRKVARTVAVSGPGRSDTPLERARKEAGLTRDELAGKTGIGSRTIFSAEREGRTPTRATQFVLALALNCSTEDLFPTQEPHRAAV
jgi:DNA-binding XRE family transcriptional regulator